MICAAGRGGGMGKRSSWVLGLALFLLPARAGDPEPGFAVDREGFLWEIRCSAGKVERKGKVEVGGASPELCDLAFTADGYLFGISPDGALYMIDQEDPTRSVRVGDHGLIDPYGMVAVGNVLLVNTRGGGVHVIDRKTAESSPVGQMGGGFRASGDIALMGEKVYSSVKDASGREHLVELDPKTGAARDVGAFVDGEGRAIANVFGLIVEAGELYGVTSGGDLLKIDPKTGRCAVLLRTGTTFWGATDRIRI